jgi:hypothetical protein
MPANYPDSLRFIVLIGFIATLACTLTISMDAARPQIQVESPTPTPTTIPFTPGGPAISIEVSAARGWQNTGVFLETGQKFKIAAVSGQITDLKVTLADGNGYNYVCGHANCCEPLPSARRDALLGQLGDEVFLIGNGGVFTTTRSGRLSLRVNDCDEGLYDNAGSLNVNLYPGN